MTKPWLHEPDRIDIKASGYRCVICRSEMRFLCAYIGLPARHPFHRVEMSEIELPNAPHGGWTFAGYDADLGRGLWWAGFDAGHAGDYNPGPAELERVTAAFGLFGDPRNYKTIDFMKAETERVARLLRITADQAQEATSWVPGFGFRTS